jgi:hypothetical protein
VANDLRLGRTVTQIGVAFAVEANGDRFPNALQYPETAPALTLDYEYTW